MVDLSETGINFWGKGDEYSLAVYLFRSVATTHFGKIH